MQHESAGIATQTSCEPEVSAIPRLGVPHARCSRACGSSFCHRDINRGGGVGIAPSSSRANPDAKSNSVTGRSKREENSRTVAAIANDRASHGPIARGLSKEGCPRPHAALAVNGRYRTAGSAPHRTYPGLSASILSLDQRRTCRHHGTREGGIVWVEVPSPSVCVRT